MVQAGPSAPVASLPVLSEMIRRLDALDSMDSGRLGSSAECIGVHQTWPKCSPPREATLGPPFCANSDTNLG